MIGYLRGSILRVEPERALIDVGGVGYELHTPLSTSQQLQAAGEGAEVELYVHTHVREDALQLFGFFSDLERRLFLKLIAVSGIGPRLAQTIRSGMPPGELIGAITRAETKRLHGITGVGKKTAERMVLELSDKLGDLAAAIPAAASAAGEPPPDEDLLLALVSLGYRRIDAERALARLEPDTGNLPFPQRLKLALRHLSKV